MGKVNQLWQDTRDGILSDYQCDLIEREMAVDQLSRLGMCRSEIEDNLDSAKEVAP